MATTVLPDVRSSVQLAREIGPAHAGRAVRRGHAGLALSNGRAPTGELIQEPNERC